MRLRRGLLLTIILTGVIFLGRITTVTVSPTTVLSENQRAHFQQLVGNSILLTWVGGLVSGPAFPALASQSYRLWPFGVCQVILVEKDPIFLIIDRDSSRAIAGDGTVLNTELDNPDITDPTIMIIRGYTVPDSGVLPEQQLAAFHALRTQLSAYPELGTLTVERRFPHDYVLYYNDTIPIKLGDITDLDDKFHALQIFMRAYRGPSLKHIDLRYPNHVVVQMAS